MVDDTLFSERLRLFRSPLYGILRLCDCVNPPASTRAGVCCHGGQSGLFERWRVNHIASLLKSARASVTLTIKNCSVPWHARCLPSYPPSIVAVSLVWPHRPWCPCSSNRPRASLPRHWRPLALSPSVCRLDLLRLSPLRRALLQPPPERPP